MTAIKVPAEKLAYWYMRLNGFFTIQNFIVHPESGSNQRTDVEIKTAAEDIYKKGIFSSNEYLVTLTCFGEKSNPQITKDFPEIPQIVWGNVLDFIFGRFRAYRSQEVSHDQWDKTGQDLWDCVFGAASKNNFRSSVAITE